MTRTDVDIAVIGGGVVGLAAALMAARQGLQVALVEAHAPKPWNAETPDLRVYALALDNEALLASFDLWQDIAGRRAYPYAEMTVFDELQASPLHFHAGELGRGHLGHIVENDVLVDVLWQAVCREPGIRRHCPERLAALDNGAECVHVRLAGGAEFSARLAFGTDGAASKVRQLSGIGVSEHDYRQKGVVAFLETELPHRHTAWQRFLGTGPLAFLPFGERRCSIVWSLPEARADEMLALPPEAFCRALDSAFAGTLGATRLLSARAAFPLRRRLAKDTLKGRVLLLGDAAHAVHPLAGQGVNLGLRDVSSLRDALQSAKAGDDALDLRRLQRWARTRHSENAVAAYAFENINRLFSNDNMALSLVRGHLLGLADRLSPVKNAMARIAAGI